MFWHRFGSSRDLDRLSVAGRRELKSQGEGYLNVLLTGFKWEAKELRIEFPSHIIL